MLILTTFLTSCGTAVKQLEIFTKEEPRQPLNLPEPLTPKLEEIKWTIITSDNADEVFAKLKAGNIDPVLFGLTDEGYEALSKNFAQIRAKLQETNNLLEEYKKYYEDSSNNQ